MKKGFTLVELLGVMVIISLVIAISFPIVIGVIKDKKQESEKYEFEMIENAAKLYAKDNPNSQDKDCILISKLQKGKYLKSVKTTKQYIKKDGNEYKLVDNCQ